MTTLDEAFALAVDARKRGASVVYVDADPKLPFGERFVRMWPGWLTAGGVIGRVVDRRRERRFDDEGIEIWDTLTLVVAVNVADVVECVRRKTIREESQRREPPKPMRKFTAKRRASFMR